MGTSETSGDLTVHDGATVTHRYGEDRVLISGPGKDYIDGGPGYDIVSYSTRTFPVHVELKGSEETTVRVGGVSEDVIRNVEGVIGGQNSDVLVGDEHNNVFIGGRGRDSLTGAGGADTFTYTAIAPPVTHYPCPGPNSCHVEPHDGLDLIRDFRPSEGDRVDVSDILHDQGGYLTFTGTTPTPYGVWYRVGIDPLFDPLWGISSSEKKTSVTLLADLNGDAEADFTIAIWGVNDIHQSDLIL